MHVLLVLVLVAGFFCAGNVRPPECFDIRHRWATLPRKYTDAWEDLVYVRHVAVALTAIALTTILINNNPQLFDASSILELRLEKDIDLSYGKILGAVRFLL
jgi:hypothetical protein